MSIITKVQHHLKGVIEAVKLVLSEPSASIADHNLVLMSDLRPHAEQALHLIESLGAPTHPPVVCKIEAHYVVR